MKEKLLAARKAAFLEGLRLAANVTAAARMAHPDAESPEAARVGFYQLRKRDAEFAKAWDEALESAVDKAEETLFRLATEGQTHEIFQSGKQVMRKDGKTPATRTEINLKALLAVLRRHRPEAWSETRKVEHSGTVEHKHGLNGDYLMISRQQFERLPSDLQDAAYRLKHHFDSGNTFAHLLPDGVENTRLITDAEFEEVPSANGLLSEAEAAELAEICQ